jgi:CRP-like cAMP-binding protein
MAGRLHKETLFASLSPEEHARFMQAAIRRTYQEGQIFATRGEVWPYLFLVASGEVRAEKESAEGRRLQVLTVASGDIFWGLAFFHDGAPMPVTLQAVTRSSLLLWTREQLLPLLLQNSRVLWELSRLMVSRMNRASEIVEDLAFQPVAGRLARLLLEHYEGVATKPVERDLTLDEMAARIGTTREMVCRVLYRFADDDLIAITRTEFTLNDPAGLADLARV